MTHLLEDTPTFEDWAGVHDVIADAYFPHELRPGNEGSATGSSLELVDLSVCRLANMRFGAQVDIVTEHPGATAVNIQLGGRMVSRIGSESITTRPGEAVAFPADTPARIHDWPAERSILGLRIDKDFLVRESERVFARRGVAMPHFISLNSDEGRAWLSLARSTFANAREAGGGLYGHEQVARSVASMLVTGLLLASIPEGACGSTGLRPRPVRRIMEAIEANPARCWSPADLAELAEVSVRRTQQCFREHVGTTPIGYLHEVRLDRVRADLVAGRGESVAEVASRWGVAHLGRFAAEYRRRHGELPSHTLAISS